MPAVLLQGLELAVRHELLLAGSRATLHWWLCRPAAAAHGSTATLKSRFSTFNTPEAMEQQEPAEGAADRWLHAYSAPAAGTCSRASAVDSVAEQLHAPAGEPHP
jgi:hypothetical protein